MLITLYTLTRVNFNNLRAEIEKKMNANHRAAREKARKLLRKSFSVSSRLEARKIMNAAFDENWKMLEPYIEMLCSR